MSLLTRQEVPTADTWDLTAIYQDDAAFERAIAQLEAATATFVTAYHPLPSDSAVIKQALHDYAALLTLADHIDHYAFLPQSADAFDAKVAARAKKISQLLAHQSAQVTFFEAALRTQPAAILEAVGAAQPDAESFLRHLRRTQQAQLDPSTEQALAELQPTLDAPETIRNQAVVADMDFGTFTVDKHEYPLSFTLYEERYQKHPDPAIRRAAYLQFCQVLAQYQHTLAASYYAQVSKEKTLASLRGYDSVIDYLLADQEIPRALYDRHLDELTQGLAPIMRRYVRHLQAVRGLDRVTYTDLQADLDPDYAETITRTAAPGLITAALAPLGHDYQALIAKAFSERWIDFAANDGKESGAFATAPYGLHPYVLMTWQDTLPAAYTLIHELGHCGQMVLADQAHSILSHEPSLYLVESPSTFHELLLTRHLLKQADDARLQRFALSRLLNDTYFHNCVTHLLEAVFQREVYRLIDRGESFDAAKLSALKRQVLQAFWGDAVDLDFGAPELTWMRQSHYYLGLYSYTYSTSMVIATNAFTRLQQGDDQLAADWRRFLTLGDSLAPIEAAATAGIDIQSPTALQAMITFLDQTETQIEALSATIRP